MDLTDLLDRSIGPAPDADDRLEALLADGHRAVRRRRLSLAAAGVAVVLVAGGTAAAVTTRPAPSEPAPVASDPSPTTPTPTRLRPGVLATLLTWSQADGWRLHDGAEVLRTVDNPSGVSAPDSSVAYEVLWRGEVRWVTGLHQVRSGAPMYETSASTPAVEEGTSLEHWARAQFSTLPPQSWP
jgi:hypothetical protein